MTGKARRRAIHKGRIPHPQNLPGPDGQQRHVRAGVPGAVPDPAAYRAGELHHERAARMLHIGGLPIFRTKLESVVWEAEYHRCWDEQARVRDEAYDWFWTPGRWELAA